ncbi:MAG: FecR family protein, partial [Venatoribacter sp.]
MFKRTFIAQFLSLILGLLLCLQAYAELAGTVIMATGEVVARDANGAERVLKRRSQVFDQDSIITKGNSRAQIRFIDNALLALQANTELKIEEYRLAQNSGEESKVLMNLVEGGFRSLTGAIGKGNPEAYKVNTPAASIGIRGTLYSVRIQGDSLIAGVWQGGIRLTTHNGREFNLGLDSPYQFGRIGPDGFTGLLSAPDEIDRAPTGEAVNSDESNTDAPNADNNTNTGPKTNNDLASIGPTIAPLEQMNNLQLEQYLSGPATDPSKLSEAEKQTFAKEQRTFFAYVDGQAKEVKVITNPHEEVMLILDSTGMNNNSEDTFIRFSPPGSNGGSMPFTDTFLTTTDQFDSSLFNDPNYGLIKTEWKANNGTI